MSIGDAIEALVGAYLTWPPDQRHALVALALGGLGRNASWGIA